MAFHFGLVLGGWWDRPTVVGYLDLLGCWLWLLLLGSICLCGLGVYGLLVVFSGTGFAGFWDTVLIFCFVGSRGLILLVIRLRVLNVCAVW